MLAVFIAALAGTFGGIVIGAWIVLYCQKRETENDYWAVHKRLQNHWIRRIIET